jgi:pimeloyl-ACP methyl ester carboxylesterase
MVEEASIPDGAVIVGSSLGGIVACEIAKIRKCKNLFLVGSAKRKEEINGILVMLHPLVDLAPIPLIQQASGKLHNELIAMFRETNAQFIRNMCHAIFRWDGLGEGVASVHRIHGRFDLVIPLPSDVDETIEGGHLIAMTHPAECVRFIEAGQHTKAPIR